MIKHNSTCRLTTHKHHACPPRQCEIAQREIDNAQRGDTKANKTEHKRPLVGKTAVGVVQRDDHRRKTVERSLPRPPPSKHP